MPVATERRALLAAGSVIAGLVGVVFLVVGDGVEAPDDGWRSIVVGWGHALVWLLLAVGLGVAARHGWTRTASRWCSAAGLLYAVFLAALLSS